MHSIVSNSLMLFASQQGLHKQAIQLHSSLSPSTKKVTKSHNAIVAINTNKEHIPSTLTISYHFDITVELTSSGHLIGQ